MISRNRKIIRGNRKHAPYNFFCFVLSVVHYLSPRITREIAQLKFSKCFKILVLKYTSLLLTCDHWSWRIYSLVFQMTGVLKKSQAQNDSLKPTIMHTNTYRFWTVIYLVKLSAAQTTQSFLTQKRILLHITTNINTLLIILPSDHSDSPIMKITESTFKWCTSAYEKIFKIHLYIFILYI